MGMGRLYSKGHGKSKSITPYRRYTDEWRGITFLNLSVLLEKLSTKGLSPSQIGILLRDSFSIIDVKNVTGMNISKVLKLKGISPEIPEDLFSIIKKRTIIKRHLNSNPNDNNNRFRLRQLESHIYRLIKYLKRIKKVPSNWNYRKFNVFREQSTF